MGSMLPYIAAPWILWDMSKTKIVDHTKKFDSMTLGLPKTL